MIRLDRMETKIEVRQDEALVLVSTSDLDVIAVLEELGVRDPAPLIAGVRRWGAVELHEPGTIFLRI